MLEGKINTREKNQSFTHKFLENLYPFIIVVASQNSRIRGFGFD